MAYQSTTGQVFGSAVVAAVVALGFVVGTGWGIDDGWSVFLVALAVFVVLSAVTGYVNGRS